jgi:group I intron endonuclease
MKKEKICGIYCIENITTGKKYIGQSIDAEERWKTHLRRLRKNNSKSRYLQYSYNKHGENSFIFYIIEVCLKDELNEREEYYVNNFNTKSPNGYNMTDGGDGSPNPTEETKEKLSLSLIGNKRSFGKHWNLSEDNKENIREAKMGKNHPKFAKKEPTATSKFYGVRLAKVYGYSYWKATNVGGGKQLHLGYFKNEIDAAKAVDKYIITNNIDHPLNFPEDYEGV